jgi:hypothetical protein
MMMSLVRLVPLTLSVCAAEARLGRVLKAVRVTGATLSSGEGGDVVKEVVPAVAA